MTLVARFCLALLNISARVRVPPVMDRQAATVAMRAIRIYRRFLSHRAGRTCLFKTTCSLAALDYLADFGWNRGIAMAQARVQSCGDVFTVIADVFGRITLITQDGSAIPHAELSDAVTCRHVSHGLMSSLSADP
jgi:putative component of membrane protein insertase Oxa1/YidC/SpoIIIJ protein YidD